MAKTIISPNNCDEVIVYYQKNTPSFHSFLENVPGERFVNYVVILVRKLSVFMFKR